MDVPALNHRWPMMNSIEESATDNTSFDLSSSSDHGSYPNHPSSGKRKLPHDVSQINSISLKPPVQLNNNGMNSKFIGTSPKPSSSPSTRMISFGTVNYNLPNYSVKTESEDMMPIGNIGFSSSISPTSFDQESYRALEHGTDPFKRGFSRTHLQAQDHLLAERKRRKNLSKHFIALSAIVPHLEKLDKASVLVGAVEHIKKLDKRVKFFEEEEKKRKQREELVVSAMKKSRPICSTATNDDASSSGEKTSDDSSCDQLSSSAVEVQVKSSGVDMLIKIECKNHEEILLEFGSLMNKIQLTIKSSSFLQFGDGMLSIGAVAQVNEEFCMTAEVLANKIRQALANLYDGRS
ncbi:transcription factor bHLH18-like [Coffea eugenioides]|uniref:transcription factor bHLH18-like n=1 Tax=Coffea eugenioides TaxID=49369 RepID=UPI000F60877C|nr:transcription factor bHLH18-like [Coffea eugenioides]